MYVVLLSPAMISYGLLISWPSPAQPWYHKHHDQPRGVTGRVAIHTHGGPELGMVRGPIATNINQPTCLVRACIHHSLPVLVPLSWPLRLPSGLFPALPLCLAPPPRLPSPLCMPVFARSSCLCTGYERPVYAQGMSGMGRTRPSTYHAWAVNQPLNGISVFGEVYRHATIGLSPQPRILL